MWFKTVPQTSNLNGAYLWKDVTGNASKVMKYNASGDKGSEVLLTRDQVKTYNFNPAMDFSSDNKISKEILINKSNLAQATIIGLWGQKQDFNTDQFIFAINGRRNESVIFSKSALLDSDTTKTSLILNQGGYNSLMFSGDTTSNHNSFHKYQETSLQIASYYKVNQPNNSLWGEVQKSNISIGAPYNPSNANNTSVFKNPPILDAFKGFTPELLVFNQALSPSQCNKFESYLAMKYGVSLGNSYTALNGDTLWNYKSDTIFNHRITGYGREDALGLNQRISTTSYEETSDYTSAGNNDSYLGGDSYKQSSPNHLLVVGTEPGNTLDNGSYLLLGDNNDSLTIKTNSLIDYNGVLQRKWQVRTNVGIPVQSPLGWSDNGLFKTSITGVKTNIYKKGSSVSALAVTTRYLKSSDGYFSWNIDGEYGPVTVKFTASSSGVTSNKDFGYKIDTIGRVYPIQNGNLINNYLFNVEKGQRIEIEKSGKVIGLRVNGIRYKETEFIVNLPDSVHLYGYVEVGANNHDVYMNNFRHGGFVDTGHRLELSYANGKASGLSNYSNGGTYLLVDRNGTGDFANNPDVYISDETDELRSKIIFNNVYWDTDGNGKDAFTFAYKLPNTIELNKKNSQNENEKSSKNSSEVLIYYPLPLDLSVIAVKIHTSRPMASVINVTDIYGRSVFRKNLPESNDNQLQDIQLTGSGIYIVNVTNNEFNQSHKIISKQR